MDSAASPAPNQTRSSGRFYRPELDALRFFAFFSVFLEHAVRYWIPSANAERSIFGPLLETVRDTGEFGLCLFFLLSAYLITELLLREERRTGTVHLKAFYTRRILRIWPLYFAMVGFGYVLSLVRPAYPWGLGRLISYLLLVGNLYTARYGQAENPAGPLWSISLEEQFYLLWPSVAKHGPRALRVVSVALVIVSFLAIYVLLDHGVSRDVGVWCNSLVQFLYFGVGALIALRLQGRMPDLRAGVRVSAFLGGIALWFAGDLCFHVAEPGTGPPWRTMLGYGVVASGCVLLVTGVLGAPSNWFPSALVYLGKISYGLYVFHLLALTVSYSIVWRFTHGLTSASPLPGALGLVHVPLALALTIILAMTSYRFFETPFLKIKERFTFVQSRTI